MFSEPLGYLARVLLKAGARESCWGSEYSNLLPPGADPEGVGFTGPGGGPTPVVLRAPW